MFKLGSFIPIWPNPIKIFQELAANWTLLVSRDEHPTGIKHFKD